jgi:hypothetical protein
MFMAQYDHAQRVLIVPYDVLHRLAADLQRATSSVVFAPTIGTHRRVALSRGKNRQAARSTSTTVSGTWSATWCGDTLSRVGISPAAASRYPDLGGWSGISWFPSNSQRGMRVLTAWSDF